MKSQRFDIHISIERHVPLIACFSLFLILIFGSVSSSSSIYPMSLIPSSAPNLAYADDIMGMPSPQDAPATTDALTAGGDSDNDDDDNDSNDDSGGSQDNDDDNNNDKDKDNDKDDEPIPKDAPATADTLTAKKIECLPGQEVTLFSTTCEPAGGGTDSTEGTTSAATVCPTSPTPTSYDVPGGLSVTNAVWGFTNNHKIKTEERDTQQTLLHRMVTPERPGVTAKNLPPEFFSGIQDPALRAACTGKPVEVTSPDGTATTHDPDGTVTVKDPDGTETTRNPDGSKNIKKSDANGVATVDTYNGDNKLTSSIKLDPVTGRKLLATEYLPGTNARTSETTFSPYDGKPLQKIEFDPNGERKSTTDYFKGTDKPQRVHETIYNKAGKAIGDSYTTFKADGSKTKTEYSDNDSIGTVTYYNKEGLIVDVK